MALPWLGHTLAIPPPRWHHLWVPARPRFEPHLLTVGFFGWGPEGVTLIELSDGTLFPETVRAFARYGDGPQLRLTLGVEDGHPIVVGVELDRTYGPALTPSIIRDVPWVEVFDKTIGDAASQFLEFYRAEQRHGRWKPDIDYSESEKAEFQSASQAALTARRGRPVDDETLRQVAEIVSRNRYDPRREIQKRLGASPRTASRWIKAAQQRGFVQDKSEQKEGLER